MQYANVNSLLFIFFKIYSIAICREEEEPMTTGDVNAVVVSDGMEYPITNKAIPLSPSSDTVTIGFITNDSTIFSPRALELSVTDGDNVIDVDQIIITNVQRRGSEMDNDRTTVTKDNMSMFNIDVGYVTNITVQLISSNRTLPMNRTLNIALEVRRGCVKQGDLGSFLVFSVLKSQLHH